jgi:glucan 1,3-beta-glucosidase
MGEGSVTMGVRWRAILAFVAASMIAVALSVSRGGEVPEPPLQRLDCVSYAHPEEVLIIGTRAPIEADVIERELRAIRTMSGCIRLYSSDWRQDQVLPIAQKLGLKVLLGAWINSHPDTSHADLDRAIALAKRYPDTVQALMVGNEVLTVKEMPIADLLPYLDEARARSPVPVTVAEVWSIWLDYPELADHVDFIGAHILPYWDGKPDSLTAVLTFIETSLRRLQDRFPAKRIMIAEMGWPSAGLAKGGWPPGRVEQARVVRGTVALAARNHWSYNVVEAFDQPWKRGREGVAGASWGILSNDGLPKFPLAGPVLPDPDWPLSAGAAVTLGALAVAALWRRTRPDLRWRVAAVAPLFGYLLIEQLTFSMAWISGWPRLGLTLLLFTGSLAIATACLRALARGGLLAMPSVATAARLLRRSPRHLVSVGTMLTLFQAAAVVLCIVEPFELASDYYHPFFAIPALAAALCGSVPRGRLNHAFGAVLLAGAMLSVGLTGLVVAQAWLWALTVAVLAAPLFALRRRPSLAHAGVSPIEVECAPPVH